MRGLSAPSALMISPLLFAAGEGLQAPALSDPDGAKKLLAEAGYPNGFEVGMDCPNDRYVNDEAICQAVVGMLARVGVKINLQAQPKAQVLRQDPGAGGYDTSFYLLGWTPGSFDSWNVLANMYGCRDENVAAARTTSAATATRSRGADRAVLVETDTDKRDQLIKQAYQIGPENRSATSRCTSRRSPGACRRR